VALAALFDFLREEFLALCPNGWIPLGRTQLSQSRTQANKLDHFNVEYYAIDLSNGSHLNQQSERHCLSTEALIHNGGRVAMTTQAIAKSDSQSQLKAKPPAIPIVIGVVGHRDIRVADQEALKTGLKQVFNEFREAYPHTPVVVMTSLAQGADSLAAWVAQDCQLDIRAALPMPEDD
jgi:hypothetical protein